MVVKTDIEVIPTTCSPDGPNPEVEFENHPSKSLDCALSEECAAFVKQMVDTEAVAREKHFSGHRTEEVASEVPSGDQDLEDFEVERRKVIDSQVVRSKKIDRWAFSDEVECGSIGSRFELLRQMSPPREPPPPPPSTQESLKRYEKRKQNVGGVLMDKWKQGAGAQSLISESQQEDESEKDLVDCASILENKEQLKSFWEKKMMEELIAPSVNGVTKVVITDIHIKTSSEEKVSENEINHCNLENGHVTNGFVEKSLETVENSEIKNKGFEVIQTQEEIKIIPLSESEPKVEINENEDKIEQQKRDSAENKPTSENKSYENVSMDNNQLEINVKTEIENQSTVSKTEDQAEFENELISPGEIIIEKTCENSEEVIDECVKTEEPRIENNEESSSDNLEIKIITESLEITNDEQKILESQPESKQEALITDELTTSSPTEAASLLGESTPTITLSRTDLESDSVTSVPKSCRQPRRQNTLPIATPYSNCTTETKIAMEIREMRDREEELRKMRELQKSNNSPSASSTREQKTPVKSTSNCNGHHRNESRSFTPSHSVMNRTVSLESLSLGYMQSSNFAPYRRREQVAVRPLVDQDDEEKPKYETLNESPIEREIRLAKEREEALRIEKGLSRQLSVPGTEGSTKSNPVKGWHPKPFSTACYTGDTQRLLATSRIQQEIEEQTRREVALRESGQIQTISQDRTDSKVARLGEMTNAEISSKPKISSVSTNDINNENVTISTDIKALSKEPMSLSLSSSSSSSNSAIPPVRRIYAQPGSKGISMQRFISSKGKDITFTHRPVEKNGFQGKQEEDSSVIITKPVQTRQENGIGHTTNVMKKLPTESKIHQEMLEMKAREEELRKQRANMCGQTYLLSNGNSEKKSLVVSLSSNPQVNDTSKEKNTSHPRRRNTLIAQWEQIIQSSEGRS